MQVYCRYRVIKYPGESFPVHEAIIDNLAIGAK
jgi:hypothetical protein